MLALRRLRQKEFMTSLGYVDRCCADKIKCAGLWWRTPFIPDLGRQRQVELFEFKVSLGYRVSASTARVSETFS